MNNFLITPSQCRAARELLGWKQSNLSDKAGVTLSTIGNFERGLRDLRSSSVVKLNKAFTSVGITFVDDDQNLGVLIKKKWENSIFDNIMFAMW